MNIRKSLLVIIIISSIFSGQSTFTMDPEKIKTETSVTEAPKAPWLIRKLPSIGFSFKLSPEKIYNTTQRNPWKTGALSLLGLFITAQINSKHNAYCKNQAELAERLTNHLYEDVKKYIRTDDRSDTETNTYNHRQHYNQLTQRKNNALKDAEQYRICFGLLPDKTLMKLTEEFYDAIMAKRDPGFGPIGNPVPQLPWYKRMPVIGQIFTRHKFKTHRKVKTIFGDIKRHFLGA